MKWWMLLCRPNSSNKDPQHSIHTASECLRCMLCRVHILVWAPLLVSAHQVGPLCCFTGCLFFSCWAYYRPNGMHYVRWLFHHLLTIAINCNPCLFKSAKLLCQDWTSVIILRELSLNFWYQPDKPKNIVSNKILQPLFVYNDMKYICRYLLI